MWGKDICLSNQTPCSCASSGSTPNSIISLSSSFNFSTSSVISSCQKSLLSKPLLKGLSSFSAKPHIRIIYAQSYFTFSSLFTCQPWASWLSHHDSWISFIQGYRRPHHQVQKDEPLLPLNLEAFESNSVSSWQPLFLHSLQLLYFSGFLWIISLDLLCMHLFLLLLFKHISISAFFPYHCIHILFTLFPIPWL